jgi:hypothetical protein
MHRDDVEALAVNRFVLTDSEGNVKASGFPAILRPLPTLEQRFEAVARVLELKSAKTEGYRDGLSHLNLIIFDRINVAHDAPVDLATADIFVPGLRRALREICFREVFLVSRVGPRYVYRPLQMLLLIEAFQLFVGAVNAFDVKWPTFKVRDLVPLFVHEMQDAGLDVFLGHGMDASECAVYRGVGIRHTGDAVNVLDFADREVPRAGTMPDLRWNDDRIAAFKDHHAAFREANTYVSGFALPVRTDPDQVVD